MSADASDGLSDALNDLAKEPEQVDAEDVNESDEASQEESFNDAFGLSDDIVAEVEEEAEILDDDEPEPVAPEPEQAAEPEPEPEPEPATPPPAAAPARAARRPATRKPKRASNTELKAFLTPVLGTLGLLLSVVGALSVSGIGPSSGIDPATGQASSNTFGIFLGVACFITALLLMGSSVMMCMQVFKERAQQKAVKEERGR
jgi:hypothetical protein